MESLEHEVARALETSRPFYESIVAIVQAHVELVERSPAAVEFMFSMMYGPQEGQPAPDLETLYAGTRQRIFSVFERGIALGELKPRPGRHRELSRRTTRKLDPHSRLVPVQSRTTRRALSRTA